MTQVEPPKQNLNTSFKDVNMDLRQKWDAIKGGNKKLGGLTGRPQMNQGAIALSQTMNTGFGGQHPSTNPLNLSNNKF